MNQTEDVFLPEHSALGKKTQYDAFYNPDKLFPILRENQRLDLGITSSALPFFGYDLWNHFEVSWLNEKGKPVIALAEIIFPADTPYLIESKSMKLYFNSFNNTQFKDIETVQKVIKKDIEDRIKAEISIRVKSNVEVEKMTVYASLEGHSIDSLDVTCSVYTVDPSLLLTEDELVTEELCSDLLRSNCLVTGQPDWGSVQVAYTGKKINHASLLQYIVSYRDHTEFGEHCVERLFTDIMKQCQPQRLKVMGCYTRRGGIDINCVRSSYKIDYKGCHRRLGRQ